MKYDEKTGVYRCQIDEQWFNLSADLLRKALAITPVIPAQPFELPPSGNTVIDFVNELGYPEPVEIVSNIRVNYVYQPWRAILTLINQCLTGTTSELLWEEFTQGIQTFFSHKASHKANLKDPKKKVTPLLIPYGRFSKVIIYYLASKNNIHRRPDSAVYHTGDDFILGNLKFVLKGETVEVFGMAIPDHLITEAIQQSSYYPKYLEMVAENTKKTPQESASVQPTTKHAPPKKPTTTTLKIRKGKPTFQLVDKDDEAQQESISIPQEEGNDPDLELAKKMSLEAHQEKGEGEGDDADMERAIKLSLDPAFLPQGQVPVGGVTIRDPVSKTTPKLPEIVGKGKAIVTEEQVAHSLIDLSKKKRTTNQFILVRQRTESETETDAPKAHEALAGPDPEPMQEDQTGSNSGNLHVSLAGPNPEHMDDEFLTTTYPKVHENLKLITDERVIEENPESHSGSMSSMKNLDDTYNFGDQFLYDKPTEDDQEKSKVIKESDSTIPDPSHQTVTSTPPVIAPFTNVSSTKPSSLVTPPPINTEATTITTSLPEITPFIALQLRVARLEQEMSEVKKTDHSADVLASIKSQVPTVVDEYLGTKLDDSLLKILERHTADLIEKYSVLPGPDPSLLRTVTDWKGKPSLRSTERSLLHDNIVPKPDLALELGKSISLTEAEEEAVAREVHATHARIVSESEPEPTQRRQSGIAFRDSFIVSKKRSSDSSKKLKGIQTLTPAEQEAADIMKALKESKKMSKRQPGTGGSNEGTGNILGVPDESTVVSRASSEGTGSKPGVPDEEKLILEWEADVDSEHFDRDDNAGDDNEETKPDPEEIYNSGPAPSLMTPGYISSGLVQISVSPTPYVPPSKKDYEILAVDPVGSPSSTTIDQDEQSTSTSPTNQEIQSQATHQGPVPQFTPDHSSSGPVLHEMMSD
ncbi:hypothetical protein Tco_0792698 [Tanacetum coccineum]